MKKDIFSKQITLVAIILMLVVSLAVFINFTRAEDDEGKIEYESEDWQDPAPQVVSSPVVAPIPTPVVVNSENGELLAIFKDSDRDGLPDVIDKHPGEDDFSYRLVDVNRNGIADDLEILLK